MMNGGEKALIETIPVKIPVGNKLVVSETRFCFTPEPVRLIIEEVASYESQSNCSEETPNTTIATNNQNTPLTVIVNLSIINTGSDPVLLKNQMVGGLNL